MDVELKQVFGKRRSKGGVQTIATDVDRVYCDGKQVAILNRQNNATLSFIYPDIDEEK